LPHGGKLYVLADQKQEIRLLCIEPASGEVAWQQTVAIPRKNLLMDASRRLQAAPLACSESILVCPTNAGAVIAVDLNARGLLWAHNYREEPAEYIDYGLRGGRGRWRTPVTYPSLAVNWKAAAPVIQEGKVIFTAPDASTVECLNLRNGSLLWKMPRNESDLYLAGVFQGKVVLVGSDACQARRLSDGQPLWRREIGKPSGQGVAAGGTYYLPLRSARGSQTPAVWAIDITSGSVVERIDARSSGVPGNLVFCSSGLVSQGVETIALYPPAKGKE
jgi:outer membrane protein assembly factor BamB